MDKVRTNVDAMAFRNELNDFLSSVQTRAFKQAVVSVKDREEALDIVQDAMVRLAQNYPTQIENWPKLFQRILQNAIKDWYRRQQVKSLIFWRPHTDEQSNQPQDTHNANEDDAIEVAAGSSSPERELISLKLNKKILEGIETLPLKQQQAFILRAWWEYDVADTAYAMNCSAGSVKTHYSRACKKLQLLMEDYKNE